MKRPCQRRLWQYYRSIIELILIVRLYTAAGPSLLIEQSGLHLAKKNAAYGKCGVYIYDGSGRQKRYDICIHALCDLIFLARCHSINALTRVATLNRSCFKIFWRPCFGDSCQNLSVQRLTIWANPRYNFKNG